MKPTSYRQTPAHTSSFQRTPPIELKTNWPKHVWTLNPREVLVTSNTKDCTQQVQLPPKFYGLPKYIKQMPPQANFSSRGSITYGVAGDWLRSPAPILPIPSSSQKSQDFVDHICKVKLEPEEVMAYYDVKALFTSVPIDPSINIVKCKLQQDPLLSQMTNMSIPQVVSCLEFCLENTYFLFQGMYYKQVHGAAMGSPLVPYLPSYSWKSLKLRSFTLPLTPYMWLRFVDDTVIQQAQHSRQLLHHINSQDPHIQFTMENPNQEGTLPFLGTLVSPDPNNTLITYTHGLISSLRSSFHYS